MFGTHVGRTTLLLSLLILTGTVASAQGDQASEFRGYYLEPGLGINWLDQQTDHSQPADAGFHLSLVGGYRFHRRWAVELHTGYMRNHLPASSRRLENTVKQIPLVANLLFHFPNASRLELYAGAGLGIVFGSDDENSGGDVALEFMVGARHEIGERTEIGLSYRFIMVAAASIIAEEAVGNDSANVALKLRF